MIKLLGTNVYGGPNFYMLGRAIRLRLDLSMATLDPESAPPPHPDPLPLKGARENLEPSPPFGGEGRVRGRAEATVAELGITEALAEAVPGLAERIGDPGSLSLGAAIAEIALELQLWAGCRVRPVTFARFHAEASEVVFAYETAEIGLEAGRIAREFARAILRTEDADPDLDFAEERRAFRRFVSRRAPGPSTVALLEAANARDIPWIAPDEGPIQLGHGRHQRRLSGTYTSLTGQVAVEIARDRLLANRLLGDLGLPVPPLRAANSPEDAVRAATRIGFPVALERADDRDAIERDLLDEDSVAAAYEALAPDGETVLVEGEIEGHDHRLLVIGGDLIAASALLPGDDGLARVDVLARAHPDIRAMAIRAVLAIGLDAAELRYRAPDIETSWRDSDGAITAIDPEPSLRAAPEIAANRVLDMLFPPGTPSRIPIATLTGTNGKTTTARMLAHILKFAGHHVGLTTTDAVYINGILTVKGDMTGPAAAAMVLKDPSVDAAVLETARGGLVRAGLGYEACDVGAVLNVSADHIGMGGVESVEDLALVKRIVVEVARDTAILNADDALCLKMADHTPARHICWVTRDTNHALVREHIRAGGRAVVLEQGLNGDQIVLYDQGAQRPLIWTRLIPATFEGKALHNVENAMFAAAMAHGLGKSLDDIRNGLRTFDMTIFQAPGRLNVFDGHGFRVILDYGHNPAAVAAMVETVERMAPKGKRIVVVMVAGDRRLEDIDAVAATLAGKFDHYICKQNDDRRGRADGELPELVAESLRSHGVDSARISVTPPEDAAVAQALAMAAPDDLVLIFGEKTTRCWDQIVGFRPTP